ncbi:MAG: GNAT family N-acetyltransferase [Boseongicola sp.]|nr:MAG: GNAT family N-acetyltransferase [Boseongicola sp.]
MSDQTETLDAIRSFNRSFTQRLSLLSRNYLDSDLSVTEARVLFEICTGPPATAREFAIRLDIDEGYLSRLLNGFDNHGWITRRRSQSDARKQDISATEAGQNALAPLHDKSRADITRRLAGRDLKGIARSMNALNVQISGIDLAAVQLRGLGPGDAGWLIQHHAEHYAASDGFDASFEALVAEVLAEFLRSPNQMDRAWIAHSDSLRLGSIFCVQTDTPKVAQLRLFYLTPPARGLGLGQRLLNACINHARNHGNHTLKLWTHETHRAATQLYKRSGFRMIASEPVHHFGQDCIQQNWELPLN